MPFDKPKLDVYSAVRWSAASKYGAQSMQFVVSLVLARLLAPEYFGLLGMAIVVTGFVKVFKNLGFPSAIIQRKDISTELLSTLFWVNLGMCLLVAAIVLGIAPAAAWMYDDARVAPIIAVLSINYVLAGFTMVPTAILTRQMAFNRLAVREIAAVLINGSTAVALAIFGWGVWALVAGTLAGSTAKMILINILCPFRPRLVFDRVGLRQCLGFGLNLTGVTLFRYLARRSDNLVIGVALGAIPLGFYALAYRLMLLPRDAIGQVVSRVLLPAFSRMQDDDRRLGAGYLRACGAIALVTFPLMAGLALLARPFVTVVLGEKWLSAVPVIMILGPLGALQSVAVHRDKLLVSKGRTDWLLYWTFVEGLTTIGSFFVGVRWGITGVASCYAGITAALFLPGHWVAFRFIRGLTAALLLRTLLPYLVATLLMSWTIGILKLVLEEYQAGGPTVLAACASVGAVTYAIAILLLRAPAVQDLLSLLPARWERLLRQLLSVSTG